MSHIDGLRFAITGGAGLVGSHLVEALLEQGARRVVVLDNLTRGVEANLAPVLTDERFELIRGDVRDADSRHRLLEGIDVLFHLSALRITRCRRDPAACVDTMITAARALFEDAAAARIRRVVAASSRAVYGPPLTSPMAEDHPLRPATVYGVAKLAAENFLAIAAAEHGFEPVVLRFFNAYGPRMGRMGPDAEVLVRWMDALERHERPVVHDGALDLVHVSDLVQALLLALAPEAAGGTFNIASGSEIALADLARGLCEAAGSDVHPVLQPPPAATPAERYLADIAHARRALGFEPRMPLAEGLCGLWRWYGERARNTP